MPKAYECPEVALAWELYDKIKKVVELRNGGNPLGRRFFEIDGYSFASNNWGLTKVADTQGRFNRPDPVDPDKVFGCYIDGGALAYDMPDPDYCRAAILPLLDRELVLDRLAGI